MPKKEPEWVQVEDSGDFSNEPAYEDVTPRHLLSFAQWILSIITLVFVFSGISELIWPHNEFFGACKSLLPPMVTLVLGFYFGSARK